MAVDEAILDRVGEGVSPPTLRFYEWGSPWVSLGSGQQSSDLDRSRIEAKGWGVLRRTSGGTAVLHQGQLGYALVLPTTHRLWQGDLVESYERLAEPLRLALDRLGIESEPASATMRAEAKMNALTLAERICFAALGPFELMVDGRKVVGNSQIRRRRASTQHGVIQLVGGQSELAEVVAGASLPERLELARFVSERVGPVTNDRADSVVSSALISALVRAFEEVLDVCFEPGQLTGDEGRRSEWLLAMKYREPTWTFRR
jgi:lipoyl(octanoyl) transferase